jgi:hypothetical protein
MSAPTSGWPLYFTVPDTLKSGGPVWASPPAQPRHAARPITVQKQPLFLTNVNRWRPDTALPLASDKARKSQRMDKSEPQVLTKKIGRAMIFAIGGEILFLRSLCSGVRR